MTGNEYQKAALRTANTEMRSKKAFLLNCVLGMNGEAGECADMLKKSQFQGHSFDREHFAKELGDCLFYIAVGAYALGYDLDEIAQMNIDKLWKRYPDGFSAERSINRAEDDV